MASQGLRKLPICWKLFPAREDSFGLRPMQTRRFGGFCYSGVLVFGLAGTEPCARAIPRAVIGCPAGSPLDNRERLSLSEAYGCDSVGRLIARKCEAPIRRGGADRR